MRFEVDGRKYSLEFQRYQGEFVRSGVDTDGKPVEIVRKTAHPRTTVIMFEHFEHDGVKAAEAVGIATVGCSHLDRFTKEDGRLAALRALTRTIDPKLREPMWKAYLNRPRGSK